MKSIHETKQRQNTRTKIIQRNDTKCIIPHYRMSNMPPYEACNLCIDLFGNTHPLKVTETYSGCHITQPIQHITLCCQGP